MELEDVATGEYPRRADTANTFTLSAMDSDVHPTPSVVNDNTSTTLAMTEDDRSSVSTQTHRVKWGQYTSVNLARVRLTSNRVCILKS